MSRGAACGDRALCATLPDGRTALILSDGMGQGAEAAKESLAVTTLTHRLLAAGAEPIPAINAVNSMMRLRGGERYATLDLCLIDPYRREAAFFKLGASLSVHLRRGISARVEGGRLPPGVVEPAEPATARRRLRPGDAIVMVTDGVADMARAGEEEWLTTSLTVLPPNDPERLARLLVEAASRRRDGGKDDMTALCAVIEAEE